MKTRLTWLGVVAAVSFALANSSGRAAVEPLVWFPVSETSGTSDQNPGAEFTTGSSITNWGTLGGTGYLRERIGIGDSGDNVTIITSPLPHNGDLPHLDGAIDLPAANGSGAAMDDGGFLNPIDGKGTLAHDATDDTKLTVAAWVYFDIAPSGYPGLVGKLDNSAYTSGWHLALSPSGSSSNKLIFVWGNSESPGLSLSSGDFATAALVGQWNHVAATFDEVANSTSVRLYLNGVDIGGMNGFGGPVNIAIHPNNEVLAMGTYVLGNGQWDGKIADVQIFDSVLSQQDIVNIMGVPEPGTLALLALGGCLLRRRFLQTRR